MLTSNESSKSYAIFARSSYGDLLMTDPLIKYIKNINVNNKITLFVEDKNYQLVEFMENIDCVYKIPSKGNKYLFAFPTIILFSYITNLILSMDAAIQIGKDEYPPIPNITAGLLNNKIIKDLNIENEIIIIENNNLKIFFLINGDDGILIKFRLL